MSRSWAVLVAMLSTRVQFGCSLVVFVLSVVFGLALLAGSVEMAISTYASTIPTLGLSEAWRYLPVMLGGTLIAAFSIEHLIARLQGTKVIRSWH